MQHVRKFNLTSDTPKIPPAARRVNSAGLRLMGASQQRPSTSRGIMSTANVASTITIGRDNVKASAEANNKVSNTISASPRADNSVKTPLKDLITDPVSLTVWFHELRTSEEDVLIDHDAIPGLKDGDLCELSPAKGSDNKRLVFVVKTRPAKELPVNTPVLNPSAGIVSGKPKTTFQISLLSNPLQKLLDLPSRSLVQLKHVHIPDVEADTVEVFIKDVNILRDSMWLFSSSLVGTSVYVEKRLSFLKNRTGTVKHIYRGGKRTFSAYVGDNTKIVFRSESAKLTFLVQLSREMWNFEENGEIMFHKVVNTLFPRIFKRCRDKNTHHLITIVLFTSVDLTNIPWTSLEQGERPNNRRDYFRVVVDQVNVFHWDKIMANLRLEFANFKRDILLHTQDDDGHRYIMEGEMLPSVKGNVLEAINLGLTLVNDRFRGTDLKHSLSHFVVITPGTGLFDVDYSLVQETSKKMLRLDCALDFVCLSQPPLHIVPLFRYKDPTKGGQISHCVPSWCDILFYRPDSSGLWIPRCKIYELQMMGVMENEMNGVQIDRFGPLEGSGSAIETMDRYDSEVFRPVDRSRKKPRPKTKLKGPVDANATLSLIWNARTTLAPVISANSNVSTTNSSVLGTVSNPAKDASALSSLYVLNKVPEARGIKMRSSSSGSRKITPVHTLRSAKSYTHVRESEETKSISSEKPKKKARDTGESSARRPRPSPVPEIEPTNNLWTNVENPSKEMHLDVLNYIRAGRWNDVFPPNIRRRQVKWRLFQSPAALPITTSVFPTKHQLDAEYTFQIYTVLLNWENDYNLETTRDLMREMIQLRLSLGFQICHGSKVREVEASRKPGGSAESIIKYFPTGSLHGSRIYMCWGDEIHRIMCDYNGTLNVQLYRKIEKDTEMRVKLGYHDNVGYTPLIRTRYADEYTPAQLDVIKTTSRKYNWNQFDQLLAGYDDAMSESNKDFHKMKFVVMPSEIPKNAYFVSNENLSDEEIRVEGLRKLIALIERGRYVKPKERSAKKKEEILPEISFYTGNLYDFLNEQTEFTQGHSLLIPEHMRFLKEIKLAQLARELQGENGINLVDRVWHFKTHARCFLGNELVSWILECFEDVESREEAAEYGQGLMDKGLFKHVENRHGLLDGYYFYEFDDEYIDTSYKAAKGLAGSWFRKKLDRNLAPKNPSDNESAKSPVVTAAEMDLRKVTSNVQIGSETSSFADSLTKSRNTKKFILSRCVKYNADPLYKSNRPEIVNVHYDRVHNPDHCYHIRLQWLNTSAKFIDEAITNWLRLCERHGLKLVETPWKELCTIPSINPFHSFVDLKLSVNPLIETEFVDPRILRANKFYYHLYLLKKHDFFLDNRLSVFFSKDNIDIAYSWGKPTFQYAQYIHRTGSYIVELRDNGDFFLAPNNIHLIRLSALLTSLPDYDLNIQNYALDSQKVMLDFRKVCQNPALLRETFREAKQNWREEFQHHDMPAVESEADGV